MIDLRGGNDRNPWSSFLPQMFQQMMMMGLKSKYDMEALKAKSIYDAGVKKEDRKYKEGQDIEKFNRALEGKRSEAAIKSHYEKPPAPKTVKVGGKVYILNPDGTLGKTLGAEGGPGKTPEQIKLEAKARAEGTAAGTPAKLIGQTVNDFEMQQYGKLVPELRGTKAYTDKLEKSKKAGATNINIGMEKFDIQKQATAGETRTGLITNKDDPNYFEANAQVFNSVNTKNEIAYWDKGGAKAGRFYDEEAKIIKLSPAAIKKGWTPKSIQEAASAKGKTIEEVLREIGIIK